MKHCMVVNSDADETRVAILEDGLLAELYVERAADERIAGNIYRGKVENVLQGMQAAFVDIGLGKNAFLYVSDALPKDLAEGDEVLAAAMTRMSIRDILKSGQEVIVQVTKEPLGTKGPRATTNITLPGRHLVLMPNVDYVGVSRRIEDDAERNRLRALAQSIRPEPMGLIVRTAAEGKTEAELREDVEFLVKIWRKIQLKTKRGPVPSLLYRDHDLVYRLVRDMVTPDTELLVVDDEADYRKAVDLVKLLSPDLVGRVRFYDEADPVFERYGVETQLARALKRRLWLDCGGYIVIDQTEALTAIDVNTGKFIGSVNLEDTVLKTNVQAAQEIGRQLRLRNIGGIVIIDFIDMASESDRKRVLQVLEESVRRDKTRSNILGFTSLGLVEMTRKKVKRPLEDTLLRPCPYCEGRGKVTSEATMAAKVKRELRKWAHRTEDPAVLCMVHPGVASVLIGVGGSNLAKIEEGLSRSVFVKGTEAMHIGEFEFVHSGTKESVEQRALPVRPGQRLSVTIEGPHVTNPGDGIARVEGFVLDVEGGGALVGREVTVEVTRLYRTFARATLVEPL